MEESKDLIFYLKNFNRKERYFLISHALGNEKFTLGTDFRDELENKIGLTIPTDAFAAMDYHLDWIDVSLRLWQKKVNLEAIFENDKNDKGKYQLNSNPEDIDFIIVFKDSNKYHLVLIEAKGVTGWTNKQMDSKVKRFRELFGENGNKQKNLIVHFLLMSPGKPQRINEDWPSWMTTDRKPNWMELTIPDNFMKVTRCDNKGIANQYGNYCIVKVTQKEKMYVKSK